jgi:FixJ family two-component response regulator
MPTLDSSQRVLVVDDDANVRSTLQRSIERIGYASFAAADGAAGLVEAVKVMPTVIVLDLRMPNMDGHTFMRRFANLKLDSAIIVTSADGEIDDVIEAMRHGAIDYVKKPFSNAEIQTALARAADIHDKRSAPVAAAAADLAEPEPSVFSKIIGKIHRGEILVPSIPSVIEELRAVVAGREASVESVTRLVACDQALAARVLQLSRSAWHASARPSLDLQSAISRIGFQKLQALAETVWLNGCFQARDSRFVPYIQRQTRFGLARALAMRALAVPAKLDPRLAYFTGLFADVGASFLLYVVAEKACASTPEPEACEAFVREYHEAIGGQLLAKWGYGDDVGRLARRHHTTAGLRGRDAYAKLFAVGTALAQEMTREDDLTGAAPPADEIERCSTELGIDPATRSRCHDAAMTELTSLLDVLR